MGEPQNICIDSARNHLLHALNKHSKPMDKRYATLNRTLIIVSSIFTLLVLATTASATDYYMATWGDDGSNGTSLDYAWATLSRAQGQLSAGDTLHIVDGTYYNDTFVAQVSGTATNPITIKAYDGTPTFIEIGTIRTLRCFNFHDTNIYPIPAPGPISYYNIDGIRIENYYRAIDVCYGSHHINIDNVSTDQCYSGFFAGSDCHDIATTNMRINGSHWNGWYLWHDNYNITATDVYVTNQVEHSFFDLHTNNDNITLVNCRATTSSDNAPGIYMGHGDYGTDDNVTITNFTYKDVPTARMIDAWNAGDNLYIDTATSTGSKGVEFGDGSNLTLKNVYIRQCDGANSHGIYFTATMDGVLLENVTLENVDYKDIKFERGFGAVKNATLRDIYSDSEEYTIFIGDGAPIGSHSIEYSDGTVFSNTGSCADVRYYPGRSNLSLQEGCGGLVTYYPLTAIPSSGSAEVTVNKFDTSLSRGEVLVDIIANTTSGNEVVFIISDLTSGTNYLVERDSVDFATKQANSPGHIEFSNSEWSSAHRFTVVEADTIDPLVTVTNLRNEPPTQNTITLQWDCSAPDVDHYNIYRDGALLDATESQYYSATNLAPDTTYTFEVSATDKGGITGDSVSITVRTAAEESFGSNTIYIADDVTASKGSYVTVPIMIYDATGVACDGVNLTYDASVVNVIGVTQGDFTTYFGFDDGSAADGWVTVNTYISETSLTGDVKIADVMLKAVGDSGDTSPLDMEIIAMTGQNGHPVSGTVSNGLFTVVSDTSPPVVAHSSASQLIPDDTDGVPSWGETATLSVTVTDESEIAGVTIDLSAIGGSPVQPMTHIGNNVWSVTTTASAGTPPQTYNLAVCATDIHGYTNMQESVELIVMRNGDVTGDNDVTLGDVALLENYVTHPGRYTISSEFVADVSGDGVINIADAMMLANYVANQDQSPIRYVENTY
ncbi:MAG: dockerin type I domain-containing protein [Methanosarcinaceae archaeon]